MATSAELSAGDTAGILDQIYRAAKGLPRRFYFTPERLKDFVHRERLRTEFLDQVGSGLEEYGIWMSYPRSSRRHLGFASWILADCWQPPSQDSFRQALAQGVDLDRVAAATSRLIMIHQLNSGSRSSGPPVTLTQQQFCEIAQVDRLRPHQWKELLDSISGLRGRSAVVIFFFGTHSERNSSISFELLVPTLS